MVLVKPANISRSTAQQTTLPPPQRMSRSLPHLCVWERVSKHFSYQWETWSRCLSLLLAKGNNAINHGRRTWSRGWILSSPPFCLRKQHTQRTDRRPLMRKLINKAINRAADEASGPRRIHVHVQTSGICTNGSGKVHIWAQTARVQSLTVKPVV